MSATRKLTRAIVFVGVILLLSGCKGTKAAVNETLTVVTILTTGDDIETAQPILVEVGNCNGFPDYKTKACTAGTENNISFDLGGSFGGEQSVGTGEFQKSSNVSFDPSLSKEFGFFRSITESMTLDPPPDGFIYQYWITTTYQIIAGEALVRSLDGTEDNVRYRYQASCSLSKSVPEIKSCQDTSLGTNLATPTFEVGPTAIPPTIITTFPPTIVSNPSQVFTLPHPDSSDYFDTFGVPLRLVPAGKFTMGTDHCPFLGLCGKPAHKVSLDAYYIDKYEVTNALYKACVDVGVCDLPKRIISKKRDGYYGNPEFDNYPVIYVDWTMAKTYCEWRGARLPTEAEWEKAARGTDGRSYPWGEGIDCSRANYYGCLGDTTKVGSYESGISPYGVYDMTGNVMEWVSSRHRDYPYDSTDGREDLDTGGYRVLRSGSWAFVDTQSRSDSRTLYNSSKVDNDLGFRCALTP